MNRENWYLKITVSVEEGDSRKRLMKARKRVGEVVVA